MSKSKNRGQKPNNKQEADVVEAKADESQVQTAVEKQPDRPTGVRMVTVVNRSEVTQNVQGNTIQAGKSLEIKAADYHNFAISLRGKNAIQAGEITFKN